MNIIVSFFAKKAVSYGLYAIFGLLSLVSIYFWVGEHFENKMLVKTSNAYQKRVAELESHENVLEKKYHDNLIELEKEHNGHGVEINKIDKNWRDTHLPDGVTRLLVEKG